MTTKQKQNLKDLNRIFDTKFAAKYKRGSKEHKETLSELPVLTLLEYALEETLDQYAYLANAIELLKRK
jgi:hypothetical protein